MGYDFHLMIYLFSIQYLTFSQGARKQPFLGKQLYRSSEGEKNYHFFNLIFFKTNFKSAYKVENIQTAILTVNHKNQCDVIVMSFWYQE